MMTYHHGQCLFSGKMNKKNKSSLRAAFFYAGLQHIKEKERKKKGAIKMTREEAVKEILRNFPSYLEEKGIQLNRPFICLNPNHHDSHPSMSYDHHKNKVHCFSCGCSGDIFDVIGWDYGFNNFNDEFHKACDLFGIDVNNRKHQKTEKRIKAVKRYERREVENKRASVDVCDKTYRILKELCPLTKKDVSYLATVRGLSEERIRKDYFRFVTNEEEKAKVLDKLKKLSGITTEELKWVPGFFVKKETGMLDYLGKDGIGILIRNADNKAVGIQIRRGTAEHGMRYSWFTSKFAIDDEQYDGGATPGATKDVLIPENPKKCICITEGRFKSEMLIKSRNIAISLQGVSTWPGIDEEIRKIQQKHDVSVCYLMFDADAMGNSQVLMNLKRMTKYLEEKIPELKLKVAAWPIACGKGIDDCIINGNVKAVRYIDADKFLKLCDDSYQHVLKETKDLPKEKKGKTIQTMLQAKNESIFFQAAC